MGQCGTGSATMVLGVPFGCRFAHCESEREKGE